MPKIIDLKINDLNNFFSLFKIVCKRNDLEIKVLGDEYGYPLLVAIKKNIDHKLSNVLISAGFHGSEPAGPWAILEFLYNCSPKIFEKVNVSFMPLVNPYGFENKQRNNKDNKEPNYFFKNENGAKVSHETKILLKNTKLIQELSENVYLDLHENIDVDNDFYIYVNEYTTNKNLERLIPVIVDSASKHYNKRPDGTYKDSYVPHEVNYTIKDGIVRNLKEESFEDYLSDIVGDPLAIVFETPAKSDNIRNRINAHKDIIDSTIKYFSKYSHALLR